MRVNESQCAIHPNRFTVLPGFAAKIGRCQRFVDSGKQGFKQFDHQDKAPPRFGIIKVRADFPNACNGVIGKGKATTRTGKQFVKIGKFNKIPRQVFHPFLRQPQHINLDRVGRINAFAFPKMGQVGADHGEIQPVKRLPVIANQPRSFGIQRQGHLIFGVLVPVAAKIIPDIVKITPAISLWIRDPFLDDPHIVLLFVS